MAEIFAEQTLTGFTQNSEGLYIYECEVEMPNFVDGGEYSIAWDGTRYVCTAFESGGEILAGNIDVGGDTGSGEPFLLAYLDGSLMIFTNVEGDSHTLAIYEKGIVLKDHSAIDTVYSGAKSIKIPTENGGFQRFVIGNITEKTVDLAMADGDMVIEAEDDEVFNKITVTKPATFIPEYILKDIEIGGVLGTMEAGGASMGYTVTVVDYDGTVIAEEKLAIGKTFTLPDAPTHERLVFDGWSSTVEIVDNTIVIEDTDVTIGALYHTASGATEVDIDVNAVTGKTIEFSSVLTSYTSIDWGDGTTGTSLTHTYTDYGEYTIKIYGMTAIALGSSSKTFVTSTYREMVKGIYLANSVTRIGNYAFYNHYNLECVVLPKSLTSIGTHICYNCYLLKNLIIPSGITIVNQYICYGCYSLEKTIIPSGVTSIGNRAFQNSVIKEITLPDSLTTIGQYAFCACCALEKIIIPSGVTSIGLSVFQACYSLKEITLPDSLTTMNTYAFYQCYALEKIVVPSGVTSIGARTFLQTYALKELTLPDAVTSIGEYSINQCYALKYIKMPSALKTISASAFANSRVQEYDFTECTSVPTLANTNAFTGITKTTKIKVPASLYSTWIAATNWSTYANYIVAV